MKKTKSISSVCILFILSFSSLGCGDGSDQPDLGIVSGTVSLDGEPLSGVIIVFTPEEGRQSTAITGENGQYELVYTGEDTKGARVGKHVVGFLTPYDEDIKPSAPIPARYSVGSDTGLNAVVKPGKNSFDFDLSSK